MGLWEYGYDNSWDESFWLLLTARGNDVNSFALSGLFISIYTDAQGVRKGRENGKKSFFEKFTATLLFKTKRSALSPFLLDD